MTQISATYAIENACVLASCESRRLRTTGLRPVGAQMQKVVATHLAGHRAGSPLPEAR